MTDYNNMPNSVETIHQHLDNFADVGIAVKKKRKWFRILVRILLGILIFFILLILFIRSPWGQNIIVQQAVSYISKKTGTKVEIGKLYLTFSGSIYLEGLYLEDIQGDTLVYSNTLEARVPFLPLIMGKGIAVNRINWNGLRANIIRKDSLSGFNYEFLIDAFASKATTPVEKKEEGALNLKIGKINLTDFRIVFQDDVAGIDAQLLLGKLDIEMKELDLEAMRFHIAHTRLTNTSVKYLQTIAASPASETTEEATLPYLIVDELRLDTVTVDYRSVSDGIAADMHIQSFLLDLPKADLANKDIKINRLELHNSGFLVEMTTLEPAEEEVKKVAEIADTPQVFTFPDWSVVVNSISLKNNNIRYFVDGAGPEAGVFNPFALDIRSFQLLVDGFSMKDSTIQMKLESLQLTEASGIAVKSFGFGLLFDQHQLSVSDVGIHINDNILQGNILLKYASLNELLQKPSRVFVAASLPGFQISPKDAFLFVPELQKNKYVSLLSQNNVTGNLRIQGSLSNLQLPDAAIRWGKTSVATRGSVTHPLDMEKMTFNFPELIFHTNRKDILLFVNEKEMGVSIPEEVLLNASFSGKLNDLSTSALLETTEGSIALEGGFSKAEAIAFHSNIKIKDLAVGKILRNEQLGVLDFSMKVSGSGSNLNHLDAELDAHVEHFGFNGYAIRDLRILGELQKGQGTVATAYKDDNIDMGLNVSILLDSIASHIIADLDMRGINLQAVRLTDSDTRSAFKLHADFKGNAESFVLSSRISDGLVRQNDQNYLPGDFDIQALVDKDTASVDVVNKILQVQLRANAHPQEFAEALQHHLQRHFSDSLPVRKDTLKNPLELKLQLQIAEAPILKEVFLVGMERLDTINIQLNFNEKQEELLVDMQLPHINYNGNIMDSLSFRLNSYRDLLDFNLGFKSLDAGPLAIKETLFKGNLKEKVLSLDFSSFHNEKRIINVHSGLAFSSDTLLFYLEPEDLILNGSPWNVSEQNSIVYTQKHLDFNDFKLSNGNRILEISNKNPHIKKDHIEVIFQDFRLSDLLSYLNPEKALARGRLDGELVVENPFGSLGILAELQISELEALEIPLGNLSLGARAIDSKNYDFDLALNGGDIDLDMNGGYSAEETAPVFHLDMDLHELKLKAIEKLSKGEMENSEGSISGHFKVSGTTADPQYNGNLDFRDVAFRGKKLNAQFKISGESIAMDNRGIYLDKFNIKDENDNTFVVDGSILTDNFTNPDFDLKIKAKNFSVLNSTEEDNDLFYGTASFDVDAALTGNVNLPRLKMRLDLHPSTNVTYVMAESDVQMEERDGVVLFVNRANPDDIVTKAKEKEYVVSGVDVEALISIKQDATFNVIINKQTGDNLKISGEGDLNLSIDPNGRMNLSGRYEMKKGHFEMNLYNLVKRRFDIAEGSSVTWSGDPMDASLDVRAIYKVETSAAALMAAQTSGMDASEASRFRQRLPFLVYLNIGGEITQPKLSFNIDMPEEERGAIGGQVYSRIQQVDQQEDERNRQVFSLLVLNRFFPDSRSDGSGGGAMALARNNLNQALSDQLNTLSDQLLGKTGIQLDFGLNSYTDYQGNTPQDRTQLDITAQKKLFDDRLILSVGSEVDIDGSSPTGESAPVIGNVAIEYLLTEDGRYRLKGFRKNQYENVIDGQIFVNGIALIFSKEFNKYSDLWKKEIKEEQEKKEEDNEGK